MFDPSIYENLKVVVEGEIYEHDLDGEIIITDRQDLVNLATMSRSYSVSFKIDNKSAHEAVIKLVANSEDLYGEILESDSKKDIGCKLTLSLHIPMKDIKSTPAIIQDQLEKKWDYRPHIQQEMHFIWDENSTKHYTNTISLNFDRKVNEDHIADFPEIITLLIESLYILNDID